MRWMPQLIPCRDGDSWVGFLLGSRDSSIFGNKRDCRIRFLLMPITGHPEMGRLLEEMCNREARPSLTTTQRSRGAGGSSRAGAHDVVLIAGHPFFNGARKEQANQISLPEGSRRDSRQTESSKHPRRCQDRLIVCLHIRLSSSSLS
jgi:hypothetical protein